MLSNRKIQFIMILLTLISKLFNSYKKKNICAFDIWIYKNILTFWKRVRTFLRIIFIVTVNTNLHYKAILFIQIMKIFTKFAMLLL